jgi:hypothetical protein
MSIVLATLLAASAPPASGSEVVWKWRPGDTNCVVRQSVGHGKFLDIGTRPSSDEIGLKLIDTQARTRSSKAINAIGVTFLPGGTAQRDGFIEPSKDPVGRSIWAFLTAEDHARLASASAVKLSHSEFGTLSVAVKSPGAALDAIRGCGERRMKEWGIDPVAWRALTVKPAPATPAVKWFSPLDYPDREKIYKNDIEVVARLDVASDGSVLKCTVVNRPPAEFIPAACDALMRNAKFRPALDGQGKPTPAPYIFQVSFAAFHL